MQNVKLSPAQYQALLARQLERLGVKTPAPEPTQAVNPFMPEAMERMPESEMPQDPNILDAGLHHNKLANNVRGKLWQRISGSQNPREDFITQFTKYRRNPESVDPSIAEFLDNLDEMSPDEKIQTALNKILGG